MPMVGLPSWQDQLSDEVHELEAKARLSDPIASAQAMGVLRVLRAYEVRVRQIALQPDPFDPHELLALPRRW